MKRIACVVPLVLGILAIGIAFVSSAVAAPLAGNGQIAFVDSSTGSPSIGIANPDGSARRLLTRTLPFVGQPAWSPATDRIAFVLGDRIALIREDGSGLRRIGSPTFHESSPRWSSRGELAFIRLVSPFRHGSRLIVARSDGSHQRVLQIPRGPLTPDAFAWSQDGRRIDWVVSRGKPSSFNTVISIDVRTDAISSRAQPSHCPYPAVAAPHGPLSVCVDSNHQRFELLRAGKVVRLISRPHAFLAEPVWDPGGTRVAYGVDGGHVAVLTLASGHTRSFTVGMRGASSSVSSASWSPDGQHLVVGANVPDAWRIATIDLRTGRVTGVVEHAEDSFPRFSPDGTRLAYVHTPANGPIELRTIEVGAGPGRVLTRELAPGADARKLPGNFGWSPDSSSLAFTTRDARLETVDVATAAAHTLTRGAAGQPFWSPDGGTIAFTVGPRTGQPVQGPVGFVRSDGSPSPLPQIPAVWLFGWTADGSGVFIEGPGPIGGIVAVANGVTTTELGTAGSGSSLSPDGTGAIVSTTLPYKDLEYWIAVVYHGAPLVYPEPGALVPGPGRSSASPAVWSPDGASIVVTDDYAKPGDAPWGRTSSAIEIVQAADPAGAGPRIPDADEPTWQPVPTT